MTLLSNARNQNPVRQEQVKSGDVAHIRVSSFSENIDKMIEKAVKDTLKTDGKLAGVVLDVLLLRDTA